MAKIQEELILIKLSKLIKNNDQLLPLVNDEIVSNIEQITQELIGDTVIVEVTTENGTN